MKTMSVTEAAKLVKAKSAPAISLYLATDVPDKDSSTKLRSNLQRLYRTAEALILRTYDHRTRERLLLPLKKALSGLGLRRAKGGIGIYHSEHFTGIVKLPTVTSDLAVAAESFHVKPVLRCVQSRRNYYLLALRRKHADLYVVTADGTKLVERVQITKDSMELVNRQLESHWQGERIPLVLAGSHQQSEAFRQACTYIHVLERGISGYVDDLDADELTSLSLATMEDYFEELDHRSVIAFRKAQASGLATSNLEEIAEAAARGQIHSLLIAEDRHIWGHLDRVSGRVKVVAEPGHSPADDLLDDLAELTINKGGNVTVLPSIRMPQNHLIAAVLRWSDPPVAMPATRALVREFRPSHPHRRPREMCA